jgi:uncharacterized protein YfaS (alpha-2-macroglobulin family)
MLTMMEPIASNRFNTLSAAYVILALDAYADTVGTKALFKLSIAEVDAAGKATPLALPENLVPRVPFTPGTAKLRFGLDASVPAYYAVTEAGFDRKPPTGELKNGLEILREYVDASGKPVKSVKIGDEVTVRLRFRTIDRPYAGNLAFVDLLPGGFEPVLEPRDAPAEAGVGAARTPGFRNRLGRGGNWTAEYADIREDRIVLYGGAGNNVSEYVYRIKATNSGTFTVPPAYAESMYERTLQARSAAATITVDKPAK